MFFESFKAVLTTLLNSKTPFYSLVFSLRSIQISSSKKRMFASSYNLFLKLKKIQDISLVFRNFMFTSSFVQSKRVIVGLYLPNSRFLWLLLVLFQEPAQDLTLFSFLEENCYIGWWLTNQLQMLRGGMVSSIFRPNFCLFFLILSSKIKEIDILIELISYNYDRKSF